MIAHFCEYWLRNEDIRKQPEGRLLERYADEICQLVTRRKRLADTYERANTSFIGQIEKVHR